MSINGYIIYKYLYTIEYNSENEWNAAIATSEDES